MIGVATFAADSLDLVVDRSIPLVNCHRTQRSSIAKIHRNGKIANRSGTVEAARAVRCDVLLAEMKADVSVAVVDDTFQSGIKHQVVGSVGRHNGILHGIQISVPDVVFCRHAARPPRPRRHGVIKLAGSKNGMVNKAASGQIVMRERCADTSEIPVIRSA